MFDSDDRCVSSRDAKERATRFTFMLRSIERDAEILDAAAVNEVDAEFGETPALVLEGDGCRGGTA